MPVKVLVVDDSAFMRRAIANMLERDSDIIVCATARSGEEALEKVRRYEPDVITMDVEMPGMSGLDAVREIMANHPVPIIMVSSLTQQGAETTLHALDVGAVDFIPKPDAAYVNMSDVARDLVEKVRIFARRGAPERTVRKKPSRSQAPGAFRCVAIGTSTGGPVALSRIIPYLPADFPLPIVVVQHMPPGFTRPLAQRLDAQSRISVAEGFDGLEIRPGLAVIAPAGRQISLRRNGERVEIALADDASNALHVPSVDAIMTSVAETFGSAAIAVILTGMGQDGVTGLSRIKQAGGYAIGQDAKSCVVYGMPRAAAAAGLIDRVVPLDEISAALSEAAFTNSKQ